MKQKSKKFKDGDVVFDYVDADGGPYKRKYIFHEYHENYGTDKSMNGYALVTKISSEWKHDQFYVGEKVWSPYGKFKLARESKIDFI